VLQKLFALLGKALEKMEGQEQGGVQIQGQIIKDLRFVDDIDLLVQSENDLQGQVAAVFEESQ
jgi:hypothetical protein